MSPQYDIAIVGGGMVGASLAVALKPLGLRVAVLDAYCFGQTAQPSYDDRSIALSYGSSRIYQGMGIWPALRSGVEAIQAIHVSDRGHWGATRLTATQEQVPALGYVVESRVLGQVLHAALQDHHGKSDEPPIDLIAPAQVYAIEQEAFSELATLKFEREGVADMLQARLVVVADGSRSPLRDYLGIGVKERDYGQTAVIANVTTEQAPANRAYERFTAHGPLALLPMTQGRYSLVWTQPNAAVAEVLALSDAEFLAKLQAAFGWRQGHFLRVGQRSSFPLRLIKSTAEIAGRAVLIGNASHTLHPVAGQGLNLALRDVALLAELIAQQVQQQGDWGGPAVLAAYQSSRRADYRQVVNYTDTLVRVFSNDFFPLAHARALGLVAVDRIAPLRHLLTRQSMGLRVRQPRLARGLSLL